MDRIDMLVIGSGPAGRRAAVQAAKLGKSVLVVDKGRRLGGVSVHTGTIPSKTLRETVLNLSGWRERGFYGQGYRVKQDISAIDLMQRLHKLIHSEQPYTFLFNFYSMYFYNNRYRNVKYYVIGEEPYNLLEWYVPKELQRKS